MTFFTLTWLFVLAVGLPNLEEALVASGLVGARGPLALPGGRAGISFRRCHPDHNAALEEPSCVDTSMTTSQSGAETWTRLSRLPANAACMSQSRHSASANDRTR
jgi:hypothetical protein